MRMANYLAPAPGVLSGYDVTACAVVDTRCDRWLYLTGDSAWAWQTVCVTGGVSSLDESEMEHIQTFADLDLIRPEEKDNAGERPPEAAEPAPVRNGAALITRRRMKRTARRAWRRAIPLHRAPLEETIAHLRFLRTANMPYLTPGEAFLTTKDATRAPWWTPPQHYSDRSISTAAVLTAHQMRGRLDLCFGVCHRTREPVFWCSASPGGQGAGEDYLLVGHA